jgi:hypothetical protein
VSSGLLEQKKRPHIEKPVFFAPTLSFIISQPINDTNKKKNDKKAQLLLYVQQFFSS